MSQELKPTTKGDENVETAEMFLARVGYSDSRVHSSVAIAILMEDYSRAKLERTTAALLGALKLLLETHCCDTGEADYKNEWEGDTVVCPDCSPARAAIAEAESQKEQPNAKP